MRGRSFWLKSLGVALAVACLGSPVFAAGFGIFEHGSKAMGMGGAFTAQADDPSAMFYNVGGLAFLGQREFEVGTTLITNTEAKFQGAAPYPGPGATGEQKDAIFYPSHLYYVQPLTQNLTFGLSFNSPFGLSTEWKNVDSFAGRFISYHAALNTYDLTPNLAFRATPNFGIGIGAIVRFSNLELHQRKGIINPYTFGVSDVADVTLKSDTETDYGFTIGILHKYNNSFSWGLSYRSKINAQYGGKSNFRQISTGYADLDAVVAAGLPSGSVSDSTEIDYPAMASFGVALALSPNTLLEIDANWTEWSSFKTLQINFAPSSGLDPVIRSEEWKDVYNYRIGLRWNRGPSQYRIGYVYDETPQPAKAASPLLPDETRNGFSIGYGHQGAHWSTDVALMYLPFHERTVKDQSIDNFFGTYNTTAWLLGISLGWK